MEIFKRLWLNMLRQKEWLMDQATCKKQSRLIIQLRDYHTGEPAATGSFLDCNIFKNAPVACKKYQSTYCDGALDELREFLYLSTPVRAGLQILHCKTENSVS